MKSRLLVSAVGIPVLLYIVLAGPSLLIMAALCALAGIGAMELQKCVSGVKRSELVSASAVFAVFTVCWYYERPEHIAFLFVLEFLYFFAYAVWKAGAWKFDQLAAALLSGTAISYSFASFIRMDAAGYHRAYLLLPFILSFASDTGGYFGGRFFGKHKLAPKVSPKKTVEGSVGGIFGNILGGVIFAMVMQRLGSPVSVGLMVVLSAFCSCVAQLGDLSFSLIKRQYGIKDYGHLFLEHGGVLDRFDSVLFVAPVIEIVLKIWGKM